MKTDNLQVAEKLAKITGRPLEDFYEPNENSGDSLGSKNSSTGLYRSDNEPKSTKEKSKKSESIKDKQTKEKQLETQETTISNETFKNIEKNEHRSTEKSIHISKTYTENDIAKLAKEWKADIGIHGKTLISNKREMTRKEYLDIRKSFKTADEFMSHPLLFIMFRSENQINPAFPHWCDDVIKYIKSNNKEKE